MGTYQKVKGKSFENKVAEIIHEILFNNIIEYKTLVETVNNKNVLIKRDAASGNFKLSNGDLDLGIAKPFFKYSVECKDHKDLDCTINTMLKTPTKLFKIWDEQVKAQSARAELYPLLIFKSNRTINFVMFDIYQLHCELNLNNIGAYFKYSNMVICKLEDFVCEHTRAFNEKTIK